MNRFIDKITEIEYSMLDAVNNIGGRAWCQDNEDVFRAVRACQFQTWPDYLCESYYYDLVDADMAGRNLVFEKYAIMSQYAHPEDYAAVKHVLPVLSEERKARIEKTVAIHVRMAEEFSERYPNVGASGRPLHSSEDTAFATSVESYMRGELYTYSDLTESCYHDFAAECAEKGRNLTAEVRLNQFSLQGISTLEEAEELIKQRGIGGNAGAEFCSM